jgi:hypothetical protein
MPKLAAAIITGTMARPSRPSVRFTALPAPTMMKVAEQHVEPAEIQHQFLEERKNQRGRERHASKLDQRDASRRRNEGFDRPAAPGREIRCASAS